MILLTIPTKNPKCGKTCKNMIKNRQVCSIQSKLLEFTSHSMSFMTLGVLTTSLDCNQDTQTWLSSLSFLALQSSMQLQNVETNNNPTQETPRYVWGPVLSLCLTKGPKLGKLKVGNSKIFQIHSKYSCQIPNTLVLMSDPKISSIASDRPSFPLATSRAFCANCRACLIFSWSKEPGFNKKPFGHESITLQKCTHYSVLYSRSLI